MDLNNDGRKDLVVGGFGGQIFWLRGEKKGFLKAETLKDNKGQDVTLTSFYDQKKKDYSAHEVQPFASADVSPQTGEDRSEACRIIDWNQDGKLDLLLVGSGGGLYIRLQEASDKGPVFAALNQVLRSNDGKPMVIAGQHPGVSLSDWDGDGLIDIVCTQGGGPVGTNDLCWYRNVGTAQKPSYAPLLVLAENFSPSVTGIEFFDVDHDGLSDLVTGNNDGQLHWYKRQKAVAKP